MKNNYKILFILPLAFMIACGSTDQLAEKKTQLEEYKNQLAEINANIRRLEQEISEEDSSFASQNDNILVSTYEVKTDRFIHQIEVRGSVESRKNVMISAEMMGRVERIDVTEGDQVSSGQLLMKINADILENNVAEVQTQLELATTVFERQSNLWGKNIGTEIQYLQAKNNKESLERRLSTLNSQLRQAYIRAPFPGVIDNIPVKQGEMAQPGIPLVRIVNQNDMYITADVSEAYLGKINTGDEVTIYFPSQDLELTSKIASVGKVINSQNRTFSIEVGVPKKGDYEFRPNQVVVLTLTDYVNEDALSIPTKIIQADDSGKYVFGMVTQDGKKVAQKIRVTTGKTFNNRTEILSGLSNSITLIDRGFRDVNDGSEVSLSTASL